jgi:hypothetical protein
LKQSCTALRRGLSGACGGGAARDTHRTLGGRELSVTAARRDDTLELEWTVVKDVNDIESRTETVVRDVNQIELRTGTVVRVVNQIESRTETVVRE